MCQTSCTPQIGMGEQIVFSLTLVLLEANLANTKYSKNPEKSLKPWHIGTHLRVLREGYPMSTNMTDFRWFSKFCIFLQWTKVVPAWKGLMHP